MFRQLGAGTRCWLASPDPMLSFYNSSHGDICYEDQEECHYHSYPDI